MRSLQKHLISLLLYIHHNVCSSVAHWLIITLSFFLYFWESECARNQCSLILCLLAELFVC